MEKIMNAWNPSWSEMPWQFFTSPVERFKVLPTFVVGEFVFITLAIVLLIHAIRQGRQHVFVWIASIVAGTANDAIFMALPIVDNFWQSQACIMLTPRMPLYIPCVYVAFMYTSAVGAWRLNLPWWSQAAIAGILGEVIYAPYDITGAKFLWWTWHDTDAPIREKLLGAPIGSSSWVITFSATFQFLLRRSLPKSADASCSRYLLSLLLIGLTCTPIMVSQMAFFQLVTGDVQGLPTIRTLTGILVVYCTIHLIGDFMAKKSGKNPENLLPVNPGTQCWDCMPRNAMTIFFIYLFFNMALAPPENHISTGVHQIVGPCDVKELDLAGHERQVYLCTQTQDEDFSLDCGVPTENDTSEWYTVCSKPHSNYSLFVSVTAALALVGILAFRFAFAHVQEQQEAKKTEKKKNKKFQYKKKV